ncbi:type II toxin-antitoxin system death-on-curing family toxin [Neolewinella litorea]|nr:Fic family protein [Neolewinella litorea]
MLRFLGRLCTPTLTDKAAAYMFGIVSNHIFHDGNQRTGLEAASVFLQANHYRWADRITQIDYQDQKVPGKVISGDVNDNLIQFTLEMSSGKVNFDACKQWFAANTYSWDPR